MMRDVTTLEDVGKFRDGIVNAVFRDAMRKITEDLRERAALNKAREITLTVTFLPVPDESGRRLMEVATDVKVACKIPASTVAGPTMDTTQGELRYNDMSEDDPKQRTLDEQAPAAFGKDGA